MMLEAAGKLHAPIGLFNTSLFASVMKVMRYKEAETPEKMLQMRDLGKALEHAESLSELAWSHPDRLHTQSSTDSKRKPLLHRLLDVYLEESKKEAHSQKLRCASHLLDKLVKRDFLNTLVVNLYPGNEGYSLMIKGRNGFNSETIKLPYEEVELLEYIDAEELPPLLVDLLDKLALNVFYSGCVIVELRDYRRTTDGTFDSQHVLLRPTSHSMLCDLNTLTNDEHRWTQEDKFNLESQILLATSDPLCLHPSPAVGFVTNKLNYQRQKLSTHSLKRSVKKCSQAAVSRRRKMAQCPAPSHLRLHDFVCRKKEKLKPVPHVNLKVSKTCVDMWRQRDVELTMPESVEVEKYAKALEKPKLTLDNTPVIVEEFTLETERSGGKVNYSRLTILQRLSDEFYSGMLYVDRDYSEGKSEGSTCRFPLGTKANVEKYITQFREIFTEEGRRQVKITHKVLGQPPTVSYTQNTQTGVQVTVTGAGSLLTQATGLAATITGQLTVPGMNGNESTGQKVQPIKLSLSLNPQVSVAPGNLVSPQGAAVQAGQVLGQAQLTLNIQQQQQQQHTAVGGVSQRGRQMYTGVSRPASTSSPVSVAVVSSAQLPTYAQATASLTSTSASGAPVGLPKSATPSATPSPTSTTPGNTPLSLPQVVNVGSFMQGDAASGIVGKLSTANLNVMAPGITIGNLAGMSQNFNLASLQGLQNLQNVQVSLGAVTLPGGIAVPLSMINTTPSLSTPTGLLVSSLTAGHSATTASGSSDIGSSLSAPIVSSSNNSVTMATALPTVTLATSSSSASGAAASGLLTSPTQVLSTPSGLLSLPIGVAGNLTQFMAAAGLKTAQGIRPGAPLFLSQIPGQQSVQLLSAADFPQASRAQLGVAPQGGRRQSGGGLGGRVGSSTIPASVILTAQTGQSHGDAALQVRAGQALTTQQLMQTSLQLASGQSATLTSQQVMQLTPQQQQQVAAQLALQKQQLSKSPQVAITATRVQHGSLPSKPKSKKRSQNKS